MTTTGVISVEASMEDNNSVTQAGQTTSGGPSSQGGSSQSGAAMGGAVVVVMSSNHVNGYIGDHADVHADGDITVEATYHQPFQWETVDFSSYSKVIDTLASLLSDGPIPIIFTSFCTTPARGPRSASPAS